MLETFQSSFSVLHAKVAGNRRQCTDAEGVTAASKRLSPNTLLSISHRLQNLGLSSSQHNSSREDVLSLWNLKLTQAKTHEEWLEAAKRLDELEGNDEWKQQDDSHLYDVPLVQRHLAHMESTRMSGNVKDMVFLLRTALTRNLGGMGNSALYTHSHTGTKHLIERYLAATLGLIRTLLERIDEGKTADPSPRSALDQLLLTRQSFGRSALLLSGGGTFGMNHIGVVKCLFEAKLLPRVVSGASAGSIVAAPLCAKLDEELPAVIDELCFGDLAVFRKPGEGVTTSVGRLLKQGCIYDVSNLTRVMRNILGDLTFKEAYNRTRRILNICVSNAGPYELPRLLNYVTAPNVIIWSAVAASCSVPLIFTSASLLAKSANGDLQPWNPTPQSWIDGSVDSDLPMSRLAEMFNVNHFIVSQVNPHVTPYLKDETYNAATKPKGKTPQSSNKVQTRSLAKKLVHLVKDEAQHQLHMASESGILPNFCTKVGSVLSQKYSGDITIFPHVSMTQLTKVLRNPTPDFMAAAVLTGERATWPKLSRIQNHCAIELALDDAIQELRAKVAFSASQTELRSMENGPLPRSGSDAGFRKRKRNARNRLRVAKQKEFEQTERPIPPVQLPHKHTESTTPTTANQGHRRLPASFTLTPRSPETSRSNPFDTYENSPAPSTASSVSESHIETTPEPSPERFERPLRLSDLSYLPHDPPVFPHASQPATPMHSRSRTGSFLTGWLTGAPASPPLTRNSAQPHVTFALGSSPPSRSQSTRSSRRTSSTRLVDAAAHSPVESRSRSGSQRSSAEHRRVSSGTFKFV